MASYNWPLSSVSINSFVGGGTTGSVLFVGTNGELQQNNDKFFWHAASESLNIRNKHVTATGGRAAQDSDVLILGVSGAILGGDRAAIKFFTRTNCASRGNKSRTTREEIMEIKLTLEELNFIISKLSQAPAGIVYEVLKLLENKVSEAKKSEAL